MKLRTLVTVTVYFPTIIAKFLDTWFNVKPVVILFSR